RPLEPVTMSLGTDAPPLEVAGRSAVCKQIVYPIKTFQGFNMTFALSMAIQASCGWPVCTRICGSPWMEHGPLHGGRTSLYAPSLMSSFVRVRSVPVMETRSAPAVPSTDLIRADCGA